MKQKLLQHRNTIGRHGLALLFLLAGGTKFVMPGLWQGYEPQMIVSLLPLTAEHLMLLGGVFELLLAVGLLFRRTALHASIISTFWLLGVTVQVTRLGLHDLAIRDLGLTFYALYVALNEL